jgi:hypothetical protein
MSTILMIYDAFAHLPIYGLEDWALCRAARPEPSSPSATPPPSGKPPLSTNGGGVSALPPLHVDLNVPTQIIDPFKERLGHLRLGQV